jgi:hypothetical protein
MCVADFEKLIEPSRDRVHAKTELVYEIRNECKGYQIARRECRTVALAQGESGDRVPPPPECFPAHGEQFANLALRVSHRPQNIWSMLPLQLVFFDEFEPAMFWSFLTALCFKAGALRPWRLPESLILSRSDSQHDEAFG